MKEQWPQSNEPEDREIDEAKRSMSEHTERERHAENAKGIVLRRGPERIAKATNCPAAGSDLPEALERSPKNTRHRERPKKDDQRWE